AEAFAPDLRQGDFHTALVADHSAVLHPLVFAAQALPVRDRAKNAGAEQAVSFRLERAVVDGFMFRHLTMRPATDFFRRGQTDADGIEIGDRICHFKGARTVQGIPPILAALTRPLTALENQSLVIGLWLLAFATEIFGLAIREQNKQVRMFLKSASGRCLLVPGAPALLPTTKDQRPTAFSQSAAATVVPTTGFLSPALISSTSRHSDCNSRISTLNDSGTPGSMAASPLTMAS